MSVQHPARTLRVLAVVMVASAACATQGSGFGVALTIGADDTVSDDAIASITELLITASGDEKGTYTAMVTHTFTRHEGLIYRPLPSTRSLTLTIEALDIDQTRVASGTTSALTLKGGAMTDAGIILMGKASARSDGGDGFVVNGPDGNGADLAMPGDMAVDITDAGTVLPGAPTGLTMVAQTVSTIGLAWTVAPAGSVPIGHYKVYRNGSSYATSSGATFTDANAPNATSPTFAGPASAYSYQVSAVDVVGREGPKTSQTSLLVYNNGKYDWFDDYTYNGNDNYTDTDGAPTVGTEDLRFACTGTFADWQPVAGPPLAPKWDVEIGAFDHVTFALKPTMAGQQWIAFLTSYIPDNNNGYASPTVSVESYGPTPMAGTWGVYNIPLSDFGYGASKFVASISGTTMTVTQALSGVGLTPGGFVTGPGVAAGTYIQDGAAGGPGTYTITPSQTVASTTMTEQHTSVWFFTIQDESGGGNNVYYIDDVKFTGP